MGAPSSMLSLGGPLDGGASARYCSVIDLVFLGAQSRQYCNVGVFWCCRVNRITAALQEIVDKHSWLWEFSFGSMSRCGERCCSGRSAVRVPAWWRYPQGVGGKG